MSEEKVLVIDDSATIRRLVDQSLTPAGYQVILAATAAEGLKLVQEVRPDLILLDHQLPGTTGADVCRQILELPGAGGIPVVVSSTLRKRAYVEYTELANVVDMLPKPYTAELLVTTIENALETAALVVESQSRGTAVPEVMQEGGEADLNGSFRCFEIRELLDFLNNAGKCGTLEVAGQGQRVFFYLRDGRILGVSASGIDADQLLEQLPDSLQNLAPVLQLTLGGRARAELKGIVELLDRKVVDPRLLRKLLSYQAAQLTWRCFAGQLDDFRFAHQAAVPQLHEKLPLNLSLLALLIEGALHCQPQQLPADERQMYVRRAIRGQNLDRAGVSARHMQLLKLLAERRSAAELAEQLQWDLDEVRRVLHGMVMAELVERQAKSDARQILVLDADPEHAQRLRDRLDAGQNRYFGKVVRDRFALQLVLRRARPEAIVLPLDTKGAIELLRELRQPDSPAARAKCIGTLPPHADQEQVLQELANIQLRVHGLIQRPFDAEALFGQLDDVFARQDEVQSPPPAEPATDQQANWKDHPLQAAERAHDSDPAVFVTECQPGTG